MQTRSRPTAHPAEGWSKDGKAFSQVSSSGRLEDDPPSVLRSCSRCSKRAGATKHKAGEASQQTAFPASTRGCTRCLGMQQHPEQQPQVGTCPDRGDAFFFCCFFFWRNPIARILPNFGAENNVGWRPLAHPWPTPHGEAQPPSLRRPEQKQVGVLQGERKRSSVLGGFIYLFIYLSLKKWQC